MVAAPHKKKHQNDVKILSCFAPNLTPVCERCVLTYSDSIVNLTKINKILIT
jgi:hypothetical protein